MFFLRLLKILLAYLCLLYGLFLYSVPDLTLVGYIKPEDGIGKVPINILETLGNKVSANYINSWSEQSLKGEVPFYTTEALNNPDTSPGKVALLTDGLWTCHTCGSEHVPKESIIKLAYSMLESTKIPDKWVKILNEEFDAVIVPDIFLVRVYENSGVQIPVFVLPIPMMLAPYQKYPMHSKSPSTPFIFGDASANKNPAVLVEAFAKAFGNNPEVQLIMRAGGISKENRDIINDLATNFSLTNVTIEEGHFPLEQYISRLASFDCYVNLSRGEGYSFIPREALALGIPVIITNNTASKTICNSGFVRAVSSNKKGPPNSIYLDLFNQPCGNQFDCKVEDVVAALQDVYNNYGKYINKARKGRKWVRQYDSRNADLKGLYRTLIKPKRVILGYKNEINKDVIITNSPDVYKKYQQIIMSNL